jgi:5-methylcytosine-specific restriction protein A
MSFVITEHVILDHCWVCEAKFDHSLKQQDHHIIPRAYGGVDGPQVSLCSSHHTALHEIALRLYSRKSHHDLLTRSPEQNKKLLWLASMAYNARLLTENDPNKKPLLVESVRKETMQKIAKLKTIFPKSNRAMLLELAINELYARHFVR